MSRFEDITIVDGTTGDSAGVDSLGHLDVIAHGHAEGGHILFDADFSATADVILIDLSDTTNYPHDNTDWIHTTNLTLAVAGSSTADYVLELGFLENVDGTDGDFHRIFKVDGNKKAGNSFNIPISQAPEAPKLKASTFTGPVALNQTAFQTDVNLASTLDPTAVDTPSGSGDMAMRVTMNAGSINVNLMIGYHSH